MLLRKKEEIEAWLNKYNIKEYELIENNKYGYVVNVFSHVNLMNKSLTSLDVKFNEIYGFFNCNNNQLKSLEGCPEIVEGYFLINRNNIQIEGLKYLPKKITSNYIECFKNEKLKDFNTYVYHNFKENVSKILEEISNIEKEKENLLNVINEKYLSDKNNVINKI